MDSATHGNEDGRRGKVLRSSRRKSGKKLLELTGADQLCLRIFDSPEVKVSHIVVVLLFRMTKQSRNVDELPTTSHLLSP
jgi:hypothetical protein